MKAYYVTKIIGDGSFTNPFRPAIADVVDPVTHLRAFQVAAVIKSDPVTGHPVLPWSLVIASGPNHALVKGNPDIDSLPPLSQYPLAGKLSAMQDVTKIQMMNKLAARGIDTTKLGNADAFADLVNLLGKQHDDTFDVSNFDVQDA